MLPETKGGAGTVSEAFACDADQEAESASPARPFSLERLSALLGNLFDELRDLAVGRSIGVR